MITEQINFNVFSSFKPNNKHKIFHLDTISYQLIDDQIDNINIIKTDRNKIQICGILNLNDKTKYGYHNSKPYIMFIPFNNNFPNFLVPYNKYCKNNKIISIKFIKWSDKYPIGEIINVYGDIDPVHLLSCKEIYSNSLLYYCGYYDIRRTNFNKKISVEQLNKLNDLYQNQLLSTPYHTKPSYDFKMICNIDPINCLDIDDMISCTDGIIGIHITDVVYVLKFISDSKIVDFSLEQLYDTYFKKEIFTTVYPDKSKPYNILSDDIINNFLSLNPMTERFVWSLYIHYDNDQINKIELKPEIMKNFKSYTYDDNIDNQYIKNVISFCLKYGSKTYPSLYSSYENHETNLHYVISLLMIIMNSYVGNYLIDDNLAIYRTGTYTLNNNSNLHQMMNINNYLHFTSPIRRFIDQYNHIRLYNKMFNYKIVDINMDINLVMNINRSLYDMKVLGNNYKRLKLINQDVNYYDGMLLEIKYTKESSILYLKWLINDDIKIVDTIFNPYLDIENDSYIFYNRLKTDEYIILKKGGKYKLNVRFNLLKSIQIPKVIIDYFMND